MANLTPPRLQTRAPTVTDDSSAGIRLGMVWINTVTNTAYIATKITIGAAVWATVGAGLLAITTSIYPYDTVALLNTTTTPSLTVASSGVIGGP